MPTVGPFHRTAKSRASKYTSPGQVQAFTLRRASAAVWKHDDGKPRGQTALDQVVEQRLSYGGILGGALDHGEGVLVAEAVNTDCGQQHQVFLNVDAVDLCHQQVHFDRSEAIHSSCVYTDKPTKQREDRPRRCGLAFMRNPK